MARRRIIRLKFKGRCRACGSTLPVGARARYYGYGHVYGMDCHDKDDNPLYEMPLLERPSDEHDDRDPMNPVEYTEGYDWSRHDFDSDPDWR